MKFDGITVWAIGATAAVLVLAGMQIERRSHAVGPTIASANPEATVPGAEAMHETYQVPEWLYEAPKEWRSQFDGAREGYAILFDYERRALLVEHCTHPGFFDTAANQPLEVQGPQCERLLTAQMLEFTDDGVIVRSRDGDTLEVETAPLTEDGIAKLKLRFNRHDMTLIPGQTNDLITDIANTPEMKAEYQQLFEFQQQKVRQQRAQMTAELHAGVPTFTLPVSVTDTNEAPREEDRVTVSKP